LRPARLAGPRPSADPGAPSALADQRRRRPPKKRSALRPRLTRPRRRVAPQNVAAPAARAEAPAARPVDDDDQALLALLAHSLEAQARRREADLPAELAAADLLRTCLTAASLADGPARSSAAAASAARLARSARVAAPDNATPDASLMPPAANAKAC
jgi:hypothetical protein